VAPDWKSAINSQVQHFRIDMPAISLHGDMRNLLESQPTVKVKYTATQRAMVRVLYTTFQASYTELPEYQSFLWEETEFLPIFDEDEMEGKKLREENQVMEKSVGTLDLIDQEFWQVSHNHLSRLESRGMIPQEYERISPSALSSLQNPRPRVSTPPPMEYAEHEDFYEEPKHLEPEERGECEWTRSTSDSPRRPARAWFQPRRHRSVSVGCRYQDRSRSRNKVLPAVSPSPAPRRRGPTRRTRSAVRGQATATKLIHMDLQAEILANSIGQDIFDSVSTLEAVRRANLRLCQEDTAGIAINPAEEETQVRRIAALITHLVNQVRERVATTNNL
jgi:hypothetical protein